MEPQSFRDKIAAKIIAGASIHRVAERLILETRHLSPAVFKLVAANKLSFIYRISFSDALAVINEMDLTPTKREV